MKNDFKKTQENKYDSYYDIVDDFDLIESSFLQQYGIRLRETEMNTDEFLVYLSNLMLDTPLGNIVAIRSETNQDIINKFNDTQKSIYNDWKHKKSNKMTDNEVKNGLTIFNSFMKSISKGG